MKVEILLQNREYYLLSGFPEADVICAASSRHLGNMSLFYGDTKTALKNRKNFLEGLGIGYRDLVCARQVHGSRVRYATEDDKGKGASSYGSAFANTDAFITDKKRLPLAIFTADCLSIFLYYSKKPAIGLIHAGWRSTKENIIARTLQSMKGEFSIHIEDLLVGFGPSIRSCCYEVGADFNNFFPNELIKRDNRYYLDLVQISKKQLLDSGVKETNIFDSKHCTSCLGKDFFSYRREKNTCGRMMSVMMLK